MSTRYVPWDLVLCSSEAHQVLLGFIAWGSFQWELLKNDEHPPCSSCPDAVGNQAESCSTSLTMAQIAEGWRHPVTGNCLDPSSKWWPCWWLNARHNTEGHTLQQQIKQLGWRRFVRAEGMWKFSVLSTYLRGHWQHWITCIWSLGRSSSVLLISHGCKGKIFFSEKIFPNVKHFSFSFSVLKWSAYKSSWGSSNFCKKKKKRWKKCKNDWTLDYYSG